MTAHRIITPHQALDRIQAAHPHLPTRRTFPEPLPLRSYSPTTHTRTYRTLAQVWEAFFSPLEGLYDTEPISVSGLLTELGVTRDTYTGSPRLYRTPSAVMGQVDETIAITPTDRAQALAHPSITPYLTDLGLMYLEEDFPDAVYVTVPYSHVRRACDAPGAAALWGVWRGITTGTRAPWTIVHTPALDVFDPRAPHTLTPSSEAAITWPWDQDPQ